MENLIKGKKPDKSTTVNSAENIFIKGARVHNLKNIDCTKFPEINWWLLPVFPVQENLHLPLILLYAEGQRRYAESLSAYARQFLNTDE